ncbi:MAG: thiamine pyrophosphate-binding protein, partial [Anaerolineae bacterium]
RQGVEVVFGIPGMHNLPLFEALRRSGIRVVAATHEQGVSFMANGYSRATGRVGVFITMPGPGFTNAFTGIAESLLDSCAVLAIVTAVAATDGKRYHVHEVPQLELARPIVKGAFRAAAASDVAGQLELAWDLATAGEPGPVALEVATEALWGRVEGRPVGGLPRPTGAAPADAPALDRVVERLRGAKRVGLVVGQGAAGVAGEVTALAEWLSAPIATTASGRGCLREDHPLSLGFAWKPGGLERANAILSGCDLVLAIGAKLSENGTGGYRLALGDNLIHADAAGTVLGANYVTSLALAAPAEAVLPGLFARRDEFGPCPGDAVIEDIRRERSAAEAQAARADAGVSLLFGDREYGSDRFFGALRRLLADDDIVVTDSGYHEILAMQGLAVLAPRTLLTPSDFQSTGYGVPAAIGAALAHPGRRVVAVVGDGGFAASGFELLTAAKERVNLLTVVLNDGCFGLLRRMQEESYGATCAVDLLNPDLGGLAASLHAHYVLAAGEPEQALAACLGRQGPVLLEVPVLHSRKGALRRLARRFRGEAREALLRQSGL